MPGLTPAKESAELFNEILTSELDEQEKLASLVWRARKLCRAAPSDFATRVAMASVLLQTGGRAEALQELDAAYGLRQIDELAAWQNLAHLFTCVLDYERAGDLIRATTKQTGISKNQGVAGNAVRFAVCSGDIAFLRELAAKLEGSEEFFSPRDVLQSLDEGGLAEHLAAHQRIVTDILDGMQSWIGAAPVVDNGGLVMIEVGRYLQYGKASRVALRGRITDALGAYYKDQGLAPGHYMTRLHTTLIEMPKPTGAAIAA